VRAYQQIGQVDQAIAHLDQLIAHYRQDGNFQQENAHRKIKPTAAWVSIGERSRFCSGNKVDPVCAEGSEYSNCSQPVRSHGEAAGSPEAMLVYRAITMKRFNIFSGA